MSNKATKRIAKEIMITKKKAPKGCSGAPEDSSDLFTWLLKIAGPSGTPYEGGMFVFRMKLPENYPFKTPDVVAITKIYHPNVSNKDGTICLQFLHDWKPTCMIHKLISELQELLRHPAPEKALDAEIGKAYSTDKSHFDKTAASWTKKHAKK